MDEEASQPTQKSTQDAYDPRRLGRNNSGLNESDVADVLCILHPSTPAAFRIVALAAQRTPQHVLEERPFTAYEDEEPVQYIGEEETTFRVSTADVNHQHGSRAQDLALRFSSKTANPHLGFCFGRNPQRSDVLIGLESDSRRVSNIHFRIFISTEGVVMLEDTSLNGTMVNEMLLRGKGSRFPATRMLEAGSIIQILSTNPEEDIKFILRIPARDGYEEEYAERFRTYMQHVAIAEQAYNAARHMFALRQSGAHPSPLRMPPPAPDPMHKSVFKPPMVNSNYGMHWNGGDKYNVVGHLGKGAFATVYRLARKDSGQLYAAKELEKKRFVKNGILDYRLDNEMNIMQSLRHPNIVQYIDYHDTKDYLYIIMEFVHFGDLQKYVTKYGVLSEQLGKTMTRQILSSLAYLHGMKITHRDIKPDNVLICSQSPFNVKLSDFGLSKVVKNDDTFLKTFCGTLLYCAPEVFPQFAAYFKVHGTKRGRGGGSARPSPHSYSQSVDIWSYAAVLWFVLCEKPPFEGVVDATGRAMFEKIMGTRVDTNILEERGVSAEGIDFLLKMLNRDPCSRPSARDCMLHPWLVDGSYSLPRETDIGLGAIPKQEEAGAIDQLLLFGDSDDEEDGEEDELGFDLDDFNFLGARESKRLKTEQAFPPRELRESESSVESSNRSENVAVNPRDSNTLPNNLRAHDHRPRLFGEIGRSAFSSGVLGLHTDFPLAVAPPGSLEDYARGAGAHEFTENIPNEFATQAQIKLLAEVAQEEALEGLQAAFSRLDAASTGHDTTMASADSTSTNMKTPDEHSTPRTPSSPSAEQDDAKDETPRQPEQVTPKQPRFDRRVNVPLPASFFYNLHGDPPTSSSNGPISDTSMRQGSNDDSHGLGRSLTRPVTAPFRHDEEDQDRENIAPSLTPPLDFARPTLRLGKLTSVPGSFIKLNLRIVDRVTLWGRHKQNTIVYADVNDSRIPKFAFDIRFYAPGMDRALAEGRDWTKVEGLYTAISTQSTSFLLINGVMLKRANERGETQYGRLHTGDEICVSASKTCNTEFLKFRCEFYHGEASKKRAPGAPKFVVQSLAA